MDPLRLLGSIVWQAWRMIGEWFFGLGTAVVYRDLDNMQRVRPVKQTFKKGPVDAIWLSGVGVLRKVEPGVIERLILPHPACPGVQAYEDAKRGEFGLSDHIIQMTKEAKTKVNDVRWYPGFVGVAVTIGEHWVHIEPQLPFGGDRSGPIYRHGWLRRSVRQHYRDAFDAMWETCLRHSLGEPDEELLSSGPNTRHRLIHEIRESHPFSYPNPVENKPIEGAQDE